MIRLCGATLGLFAFAVTVLIGALVGNGLETVLLKGIWAMFVFCGLGQAVGWVAYRVIDEHAVELHRRMWPEEAQAAEGDAVAGKATEPRGETLSVVGT